MHYVVDLHLLAYRAHYGFSREPLLNSRGENVGTIYGVANALLTLRQRPDLTGLVAAWENRGPKFRHALFAGYKAGRKPVPEDLATQMPILGHVCAALRVPVAWLDGFESDDIMASIAKQAAPDDVTIVSSDKDLLCCVNERVCCAKLEGRDEDLTVLDAEHVRAKHGVEPSQMRDLLALMGDSTDNIPGCPGIGGKIAAALLRDHESIEGIYEYLGQDRVANLLVKHREDVMLARELVTVREDLVVKPEWLAPAREPDWPRMKALCERYEIAGRLRRYFPSEAAV